MLLGSGLKFSFPRYVAVTLWRPLAIVLVVSVAWPKAKLDVPITTPST